MTETDQNLDTLPNSWQPPIHCSQLPSSSPLPPTSEDNEDSETVIEAEESGDEEDTTDTGLPYPSSQPTVPQYSCSQDYYSSYPSSQISSTADTVEDEDAGDDEISPNHASDPVNPDDRSGQQCSAELKQQEGCLFDYHRSSQSPPVPANDGGSSNSQDSEPSSSQPQMPSSSQSVIFDLGPGNGSHIPTGSFRDSRSD
ncbi:hypothetical protein V5O48_014758 [Marasmius crinis-equi]|uniref:Uncharacterized protein n=1 Tax=Marasmius crinis-equi TaxID=585013 RepID=A0ABR3EWE0_9AGAR